MTRLLDKGAEGDRKTVTSLMGCALPPTVPEQDKPSRFRDSDKVQPAVLLVIADEVCSCKGDLRLSQEVK